MRICSVLIYFCCENLHISDKDYLSSELTVTLRGNNHNKDEICDKYCSCFLGGDEISSSSIYDSTSKKVNVKYQGDSLICVSISYEWHVLRGMYCRMTWLNDECYKHIFCMVIFSAKPSALLADTGKWLQVLFSYLLQGIN